MAETQVFGEAPVFVSAFEKRGVILVRHSVVKLKCGREGDGGDGWMDG